MFAIASKLAVSNLIITGSSSGRGNHANPPHGHPGLSSNGGGAGGNTKDTLLDSVGDLDDLIVGVAEMVRGKYPYFGKFEERTAFQAMGLLTTHQVLYLGVCGIALAKLSVVST